MVYVRFTLFTGDGAQTKPISQVLPAEVPDFKCLQNVASDLYKDIIGSNQRMHLHYQNDTGCTGDGDVLEKLWDALTEARRLSSSDSPIYFVCFPGPQQNVRRVLNAHDEQGSPNETSSTTHPFSISRSIASGERPEGSSFEHIHRQTRASIASINENENESRTPSNGHKRRLQGNSTLDRPTKLPRIPLPHSLEDELPPGSKSKNVTADPPVPDDSAIGGPEDVEMMKKRLHTRQFLVGNLTGSKYAVSVSADERIPRLKHFILDRDYEGNPLGPHQNKRPIGVNRVEYRGVFEKYQHDQKVLVDILRRLSMASPEQYPASQTISAASISPRSAHSSSARRSACVVPDSEQEEVILLEES